MATLHVRSVPEDLYKDVKKLATERNRSLSAQVVTMLAQAVEDEKSRETQSRVLDSIRRRRFSPPKEAPTSSELFREDRRG
jgi:plasmid stability protein